MAGYRRNKSETADNLTFCIDNAGKRKATEESPFENQEKGEEAKPAMDIDHDPPTLELGVQCTVENISDINTSTQTFGCRIKFKICWEATQEDIESWTNGGKYDLKWVPRSFKPALTWPNALTPPFITVKDDYDRYYTCVDESINDGKLLVSYDFLAYGVFVEPFELNAFPFDTQDLRVKLKLDHKSKNKKDPKKVSYRFVPSLAANDFIKFDLTNSVTAEWTVHAPIAEFGWTNPKESKKGHRYPLFQAKVKIERNTGFYLSRVCVTWALFSFLSFAVFAIPVDGVADRLAIMFSVLLTVIAYQLVVNRLLPVLNFLTFIDKYMTANIMFLGVIVLENSIVGYMAHEDIEKDDQVSQFTKVIDAAFFYGMIGLWVVAHCIFIFWGKKTKKKELTKLDMGSEELLENGFIEAQTIGASSTFFIAHKDINKSQEKIKQLRETWKSVTMKSHPKD